MGLFQVVAILITLAALFGYVNHRYIHLHVTVGVMLIALVLSLTLNVAGQFATGIAQAANQFVSHVHFGDALLHWMLGFLLFAGALTVDVNELLRHRGLTSALATVGTAISTVLLGLFAWGISHAAGVGLSPVEAFLLGAILSPTDPVAVLATIKRVNAPADIENIVAAESLFNDGVGVVLFLTLASLWRNDQSVTATGTIILFFRQALGGAILGLVTGSFVYWLLKTIRNYQVEVLLTLALTMGSYALGDILHVSGPIAVVVAGLLIGNHGQRFDLKGEVTEHLSMFWELIEEVLNAVLFLLIGLQVMVIHYSSSAIVAGILMIPAALVARGASVAGVLGLFRLTRRPLPRSMAQILTWGGLRGGLAVAMALSLPAGTIRERLVVITYIVVIFSIVVQGTTTGKLVEKLGVSRLA